MHMKSPSTIPPLSEASEAEIPPHGDEIAVIKQEINDAFEFLRYRIYNEGYNIPDDSLTYEELLEKERKEAEEAERKKMLDEEKEKKRNERIKRRRKNPIRKRKNVFRKLADVLDDFTNKINTGNETEENYDLFDLKGAMELLKEKGIKGILPSIKIIERQLRNRVIGIFNSERALLAEHADLAEDEIDKITEQLEFLIIEKKEKITRYSKLLKKYTKSYHSKKRDEIHNKINRLGLDIEEARRKIKKMREGGQEEKKRAQKNKYNAMNKLVEKHKKMVQGYEAGIAEIDEEIQILEDEDPYLHKSRISRLLKERNFLVGKINEQKEQLFKVVENPNTGEKGITSMDVERHKAIMSDIESKNIRIFDTVTNGRLEEKKKMDKEDEGGEGDEVDEEKGKENPNRKADFRAMVQRNLTKLYNALEKKHIDPDGSMLGDVIIPVILTGKITNEEGVMEKFVSEIPVLGLVSRRINALSLQYNDNISDVLRKIIELFEMSGVDLDSLFEAIEKNNK